MNFFISLLASLLASVIILAAGFLVRNRIKAAIKSAFYHIVGIGIDAVYPNLDSFESELDALCYSSSNIKVLSFRGGGGCKSIFKNKKVLRTKHVEILIANPFSSIGRKWILSREDEVKQAGYPEMGERDAVLPYEEKVKKSIEELIALRKSYIEDLNLYLYDTQAIWCMYIFDDKVAFIGGFTKKNLGRFGTFYKVSGKNLLLDVAIRQYEYIRDRVAIKYHPKDNENITKYGRTSANNSFQQGASGEPPATGDTTI